MHRMQYDMSFDYPLQRPLIISCSGGGGHLSSIECLIQELMQTPNVDLVHHQAQKHGGRNISCMRCVVKSLIFIQSIKWLGKILMRLNQYFGGTALPNRDLFKNELTKLKKKSQNNGKRLYIDMLLDVYPAGYEFAAIFNAFQVHDNVIDIQNTIKHQGFSDNWHYRRVYQYFLKKLQQAERRGMPYTHILSTQSQAMQAVCDAVLTYNCSAQKKISIHQYMTDLPSAGAIHFTQPLNRLNHTQKKCIILMLMSNNSEQSHALYITSIGSYQAIKSIQPSKNPMVKNGFKQSDLVKYLQRNSTLRVQILTPDGRTKSISILPQDTVFSIMLGALGGIAMVDYFEQLLKHPRKISHIFLFRGDNSEVDLRIQALLLRHNGYAPQVHILCFQTDVETAPIMTRSDAIILRSGGISTMEHMSMPVKRHKFFFIHHPRETSEHQLTTGLLWEDANADALDHFLTANLANVIRTNPARISEHFPALFQSFSSDLARISPSKKMAIACEYKT